MAAPAVVEKLPGREAWYDRLMAHASGQGNDDALARMLASWITGAGALPRYWGLSREDFTRLMAAHFPGFDTLDVPLCGADADGLRGAEVVDLVNLMTGQRAGETDSELWAARIVAVGCLGSDHLWQDLGLWSRAELTALMERNFPALAARNVQNMKWKKFLYKQLCNAEGVYVCRAPSCEVCADYQACFGPED
jgi:nitrogen fixation protein NifQ